LEAVKRYLRRFIKSVLAEVDLAAQVLVPGNYEILSRSVAAAWA